MFWTEEKIKKRMEEIREEDRLYYLSIQDNSADLTQVKYNKMEKDIDDLTLALAESVKKVEIIDGSVEGWISKYLGERSNTVTTTSALSARLDALECYENGKQISLMSLLEANSMLEHRLDTAFSKLDCLERSSRFVTQFIKESNERTHVTEAKFDNMYTLVLTLQDMIIDSQKRIDSVEYNTNADRSIFGKRITHVDELKSLVEVDHIKLNELIKSNENVEEVQLALNEMSKILMGSLEEKVEELTIYVEKYSDLATNQLKGIIGQIDDDRDMHKLTLKRIEDKYDKSHASWDKSVERSDRHTRVVEQWLELFITRGNMTTKEDLKAIERNIK